MKVTADFGIDPAALVFPKEDTAAVRALLAWHLRHTARTLFRLPCSRLEAPVAQAWGQLKSFVGKAARDRSLGARVGRVLHRVTVSGQVHASALEASKAGAGECYRERIRWLGAILALELAAERCLPPGGFVWPLAVPFLQCSSAMAGLEIDEAVRAMRFAPACVTLERDGPGGWRIALDESEIPTEKPGVEAGKATQAGRWVSSLWPVTGNTLLVLHDHNPLRGRQAHPELPGPEVSLAGHSRGTWVAALRRAHDLLCGGCPVLGEEMDLMMQQWVPVGFDRERHISQSYPTYVGSADLSLHPRPIYMMEGMVHEFQHNKLHALMALDPMIRNDRVARYVSPVRPDPRPLHGVLLAVHAFVAVAEVYRRLVARDAAEVQPSWVAERIATIHARNEAGLGVLEHNALWTPAGRALFDRLLAYHQRQLSP